LTSPRQQITLHDMITTATLPVLTTDRLLLRGLESHDIDAIFHIFADPQTVRYWSAPPMQQMDEAHAYLARVQAAFAQRSAFRWGIVRRADEQLIGSCVLFHIDEQSQRAEVGYILGREAWGLGFAQEALTALIDFAFATLPLRRLEAEIDTRNAASIRLAERLGFVQEGLLRERWLVAGETSDSYVLGLLKREWQAHTL